MCTSCLFMISISHSTTTLCIISVAHCPTYASCALSSVYYVLPRGLGGERWLHASPMATPLRSRPPPCLSGGWRRQEGTARPIGHLGISRQAIPGVTGGTESCCLPEYASIWRQSHPQVEKKAGQGGRTGCGQGACPADRAAGQVGQPPCPAGQGGRQGGCPDPVRSDRGLS